MLNGLQLRPRNLTAPGARQSQLSHSFGRTSTRGTLQFKPRWILLAAKPNEDVGAGPVESSSTDGTAKAGAGGVPPPPPMTPSAAGATVTLEPDTAIAGSKERGKPFRRELYGLKMALLGQVASLDRGLAANARQVRRVNELVQQIEELAGPGTQNWTATGDETLLDMLQGNWRLLYTSGFNAGSLGGARPGPPAALVPAVLGQVYQRIHVPSRRLDNIVEFLFTLGLPFNNPLNNADNGSSGSPALRLTLGHDFSLRGSRSIEIVYEDTMAELAGTSLPALTAPKLPDFLQPPPRLRAASFDVVFIDRSMRITRGDRGELRIYLRDDANDPAPVDIAAIDEAGLD